MRKFNLLLLLVSLVVLMIASGCNQETVDERERFLIVNDYVEEVIPAVTNVLFDLNVWHRDQTDHKRIEWLAEHKELITTINHHHFSEDDFPDYEEMKTWSFIASNNDLEWVIEGEELAAAVKEMKLISESLIEVIELITEFKGELSDDAINDYYLTVEEAQEALHALRWLFFQE
jgi:hypothetical protein